MALHADLLESIPQTKYLSAESYISYRSIMRVFYLEYQNMHYQLERFVLKKRGSGTCSLLCTDGTLTMPDCMLIFEESADG